MSNEAYATTDVGVSSVTTDSARKDVRYEVLDMNSQGMYFCQCQRLDEAEALLTQAYNLLENDTTINHAQTVDQLRSTTLNNLGVVECHKGLHKQALNHLEVAQTLEQQWQIHSPSVSLNICAACNALGMFDRASTAALDTIEMLRQAAKSEASERNGADPSAQAASGSLWKANPSDGENNVLWGAAWHNLAVAQLNICNGKDMSEYTNVLAMFWNAMKATTDLLGADHPMTKAVHDTFRSVRSHLREAGAFKQHRALLTAELPPISGRKAMPVPDPGMTAAATLRKQNREFHITIRGKETRGAKLVERYHPAAYPGEEHKPSPNSPRNFNHHHLQGIHLSGTLVTASSVYQNPHPLLMTGGTKSPRRIEYVTKSSTSSNDKERKYLGGESLPQIEAARKPSSVRNNAPRPVNEYMSGDMWVEAPLSTSPRPAGQSSTNSTSRAVRPIYSQQLYSLDQMDDQRVLQPLQTAQMDKPSNAIAPSKPSGPKPQAA